MSISEYLVGLVFTLVIACRVGHSPTALAGLTIFPSRNALFTRSSWRANYDACCLMTGPYLALIRHAINLAASATMLANHERKLLRRCGL